MHSPDNDLVPNNTSEKPSKKRSLTILLSPEDSPPKDSIFNDPDTTNDFLFYLANYITLVEPGNTITKKCANTNYLTASSTNLGGTD